MKQIKMQYMHSLVLATAVMLCSFTAAAQQNMLAFGKAELQHAFTEIRTVNSFGCQFFIEPNLQERAYRIIKDDNYLKNAKDKILNQRI